MTSAAPARATATSRTRYGGLGDVVELAAPPESEGPEPGAPPITERPYGWRPPVDHSPPTARETSSVVSAGRSTLLVVLAICAGAAAQWFITKVAKHGDADNNDLINDGITLTVLLYVVVGVALVAFLRRTASVLRWHDGDPLTSAGTGILRGLLMGGVVTGLVTAAVGHPQGDSRFTDLISEDNPIRILFTFVIALIAAPLIEETLFRGVLLESWRQHMYAAILVSGFAFAAWHLNGSAIFYYWVMGIVLGRVYLRRGLVGSMAAHATFNAVVLGVTVASVSGGGHTFHARDLTIRTPASWHEVSAARINDLAAFEGPSGSAFEVSREYDHPAMSTERAKLSAAASMRAFVANVTRTGAVADGSPYQVDLPIGAAEAIRVRAGNQLVVIYYVVTVNHTYVLASNAASSRTAARQLPTILAGLREE